MIASFAWLPRCVCLILLLLLSACGERLYFYYPSHERYASPPERGLAYKDIYFDSGDGTRLHAWFIPAKGPARATIVHFHGNTKNISGHLRYVEWLPEQGFNLFLFDYRGFGESQGRASPGGVVEDGLAALRTVRTLPGVDPERLLVLGQSLGGSYALVTLARDRAGVKAVAIEGAFTTHRAIARELIGYPSVPDVFKRGFVWVMVGTAHDPSDHIGALSGTPLLLIHGAADQTIRVWHGDRLFALAGGPKQYWRIEGGTHLDTFVYRPDPYRRRLVEFFDAALAAAPPYRAR